MGLFCQILINKPKEGVNKAGQSVTGIVNYRVDSPTEFKDVTLSFIGKGKCHWTDDSNDDYTGTEKIINTLVNICNKKQKELITLHGEYQYPFEFLLPEDIPQSYKDKKSSITYKIVLKFVKPRFSFNKVFTTEVPVHNYITPKTVGPVIFGLDKKFTSLFTKTPVINLKAEIHKTCLTPGENACIAYKLNNDTDVRIICLRTELYSYKIYTADCGEKKIKSEKVKTCEVETTSIAERSTFEYACVLPTVPDLYSLDNSKVIKKEYRVRVTVQLPMPYKNAVVEMPVLIKGAQKGSFYSIDEAAEDDEPPSYWEAMCEEDEEKENK